MGSFAETYNDSVSFQVDEGPKMEGATHCYSINRVFKTAFYWQSSQICVLVAS